MMFWAPSGKEAHLQDLAEQLGADDSGLARLWDEEHDTYLAVRILQLIAPQFNEKTMLAFRSVGQAGSKRSCQSTGHERERRTNCPNAGLSGPSGTGRGFNRPVSEQRDTQYLAQKYTQRDERRIDAIDPTNLQRCQRLLDQVR